MSRKCAYITVVVSLLFLQSCGVLIYKDRDLKEHQIHEEQYQPYKLQNTIEGYQEFIAKYPKNLFVKDAKLQIENLEFAPYEEADSVEGYMDFKIRYPNNRHVPKANVKVELKRYEAIDTIEGYKEFLSKYPESTFAVLAKERLQELEFRDLDSTLRKKHRFDLLQYRLTLKRLKEKLGTVDGVNLGDFTCFSSFTTHEDKRYFHTHLIYPVDLYHLDATSHEVSEMFFDPIVSKVLAYLDSSFISKRGIDGFSFDVSSSAHYFHGDRKILLEYYFFLDQVNLFATHKMDKKELLARSVIISPKELVSEVKEVAPTKVEKMVDLEKLDGLKIMTMVSERKRGKNYIISRSWKRGRHSMKTIEKKKNLRGKDGFIDKSVMRYIDPPIQNGTIILTWNYKNREKAFWCKDLRRTIGGSEGSYRIKNTNRLRAPAELDFCLTDYVDINVGEERHELLRSEDYEGKNCFVVESTPLKKDIRYGKRISWIDQHNFTPLKTEYFDKRGEPWKTSYVEWQNKFGFWFWKKAVVKNVQKDYKTFITIEDVRVNLGLNDRDFTKQGLDRQRHGF